MKPLNKKVLVKLVEPEQLERSGLILAPQRDSVEKATVVSVSSPSEVAVGDVVLIKTGAGIKVNENRLVASEDILAIVEA